MDKTLLGLIIPVTYQVRSEFLSDLIIDLSSCTLKQLRPFLSVTHLNSF